MELGQIAFGAGGRGDPGTLHAYHPSDL